ncbi:unnamed protein product [Owenia fusiformis]|uniref:Uncharacterized protein n=1 Tax=Owenia fusiformis TaxID=6347 RepID=A0A8J1XWQ2_OWEFU|nr:unnamed protein product [Owenia fusiformis]
MADEAVENAAQVLGTLKEAFTPPRRGNPPRIRKKNKLIFGDEDDVVAAKSPKKQSRHSASKSQGKQSNRKTAATASSIGLIQQKAAVLSTPDKKVAQTIGVRLRNLLKLPKAHKWVCYEWFYSNLDKPLFEGENDFSICLRESFPQLKTTKLSRVEWCKIRRLMGKPRRCSPAFFEEERRALNAKRCKIRLLQQRKVTELTNFKDLPPEIPMPLVIGTKVTARLRQPQDGLFTGTIEALDTVHNTYRVTFERGGLGTHSIPDYEILSNEPQDTLPISAFQQKNRQRNPFLSPPRFIPGLSSPQLGDNDPLLGASPLKGRILQMDGGTYGGFPIKFLVLVTRLSKILTIKKEKVKELREMNTQAEKMKSYVEPITIDFQKKYAGLVLELERLNKDLNDYLNQIQELVPDTGMNVVDQPNEIKQKCDNEAEQIVKSTNASQGYKRMAKNDNSLELITKLTSIMLQIKTFAENDSNSFEFKSLQDTLTEIKGSLDPNNLGVFQNNVEIHVNHIQSGLSQMGNLHAFSTAALKF